MGDDASRTAPAGYTIERIPGVRVATDEQIAGYVSCFNVLHAEAHPHDRPTTVAQKTAALRNIPDFADVWPWWLVRDAAGRVVAECHLIESVVPAVDLGVLPDHRRRGLGSALLTEVAAEARRHGKTALAGTTYQRIPAGAAFCQRIRAQVVDSAHVNRLVPAEVDRSVLDDWLAAAPTAAYTMIGFAGRCPDELVTEVVDVLRLLVPEVGDVEDFRGTEQMDLATTTRWTLAVRDNATGTLAGLTDVHWYDNQPETVWQRNTIVRPEYRGRSLGKWLKAAMLRRILDERPDIVDLRTGNADSNAPMLAINRRLGFRPYLANQTWQVDLDALPAR